MSKGDKERDLEEEIDFEEDPFADTERMLDLEDED